MKTNYLLLLAILISLHQLAIAQISTTAQLEETQEDFIVSKQNQFLEGRVTVQDRFFLGSKITQNNLTYKVSDLKYVKTNGQLYAIAYEDMGFQPKLFERVSKGRINLFRKVTTSYNYNSFGTFGFSSSTTVTDYYSRGLEDVKKATRKSLMVELADNPESVFQLEKYRKTENLEIAGYLVLAAGCLATAVQLNNTSKANEGLPSAEKNIGPNAPTVATLIIAAGGGLTALICSFNKHQYKRNAIDIYNDPSFSGSK